MSFQFLAKPVYESTVYRIYVIGTDSIPEPKPVDSCLRFRLLKEGEVPLIRQVEDMSEWLEGQLASKIRQGSLCLVAVDGNRVIGFNLVSTGVVWIPLINLTYRFAEDMAWSEQIFTHHNSRKKGLATQLRRLIMAELKSRGINWLWGGALRDNLPSLQLARKIGFIELGDVYYTRRFRRPSWRYEELRNEHNRTHSCLPSCQGDIPTFQLPSQPEVHRG